MRERDGEIGSSQGSSDFLLFELVGVWHLKIDYFNLNKKNLSEMIDFKYEIELELFNSFTFFYIIIFNDFTIRLTLTF